VAQCGFIIKRRFGGTSRLHLQGRKSYSLTFSSFARHVLPKCRFIINLHGRLLGCGAVLVYYKPTFRRKESPPSSGYKKLQSNLFLVCSPRSSEMSVYNKRTRRHIPEDGTVHNHYSLVDSYYSGHKVSCSMFFTKFDIVHHLILS
jgi:hypothetical protein